MLRSRRSRWSETRRLYLKWQRDRLVLTAEHRDAPAPPPLALRLASGPDGSGTHLEVLDASDPVLSLPTPNPSSVIADRIVERIRSAGRPLTRIELRRQLRLNNQRLGEVIAELEESGLLVRLQQGWSLAGEGDTLEE